MKKWPSVIVVLVLYASCAAPGAEPNWRTRYDELRAQIIRSHAPPKLGERVTISTKRGALLRGELKELTQQEITITIGRGERTYHRAELTSESRAQFFAEDRANHLALERLTQEKKAYRAKQQARQRASTRATRKKSQPTVRRRTKPLPPIDRNEKLRFHDACKALKELTDDDFSLFADRSVGRPVEWTGWVEGVRRELSGPCQCWIDMDPPSAMVSDWEVVFSLPESEALKLKKDKKCTFTGKIKEIRKQYKSLEVVLTKVEFM